MNDDLTPERRTLAPAVWALTAVALVAGWLGLLAGANSVVYVLMLVLGTVWLPAFAWWYARREPAAAEI